MNTNKPIVVLLVMLLVVQIVSLVNQANIPTNAMTISLDPSSFLPTLEPGEYFLDRNGSQSFTLDVEDWATVTVTSYDDMIIQCDGYNVDEGWSGEEESCLLESGQHTITIAEFGGDETYYDVRIETPETAASLQDWEFDQIFTLNGADDQWDYLYGNVFAFSVTDGVYEMTIHGYSDLVVQDTYGEVTNYQGWDFTYSFEEGQYLVTMYKTLHDDSNLWVEFNLVEQLNQEEPAPSQNGILVPSGEEFTTTVSLSEESLIILSSYQDLVVKVFDMGGNYLGGGDDNGSNGGETLSLEAGTYQLMIYEYGGSDMLFEMEITPTE